MIVTIALNPSINKLAVIDGLEVDGENKVQDYRITLGESPIYTAYMIKLLQGEPYVLGFLGGMGGRFIQNVMQKSRIKSDFIFNIGESQSIYKIVDSINLTETTLIDNNMTVDERDKNNLKHKLQNKIKDAKVLVIGGDLPKGTDYDFAEHIIEMAIKHDTKIISSLKGQNLRKSLSLNLFALKISDDNISDLVDIDTLTYDNYYILKKLYDILTLNKIHYLVYDSNDGVYVISKSKICKAVISETKEISDNIGSSDSLVGALAVSIERRYEQEKLAKYLMASKIAVKNSKYPTICNRKDIDYYYNKVKIVEIMNRKRGFIE
ncbi:tagatose-6-phosphate kinase [Vallitalea longa]|uniref:Tagatose-6-phosphate kinase n=1 Tax=Vallitalea longa TaxID=2936439 RepID=A0A9W6DE27_9FIRM|nr:PfkB family carbohydrate kinase [Vallitalea longa]GKX27947.1 tagatose-6-phosphate kinase [Vallitalea longa]